MKMLLPLLSLAFIFSCSASKEEQLIADYEQTIGSTKTDLSLDIKSLEFLGEIKAADSLAYFNDILGDFEMTEEKKEEGRKIVDAYENKWPESTRRSFKSRYETIKLALTASEGKERYDANPEALLANKYKAVYTIKNPLLNNAEQTITKLYYINPESSKIIATEGI